MDKKTQLSDYVDSVITQLNVIKADLDKEIKNEYYTLACIAWRMEIYSIGGIRRRRGKDDDSDDD